MSLPPRAAGNWTRHACCRGAAVLAAVAATLACSARASDPAPRAEENGRDAAVAARPDAAPLEDAAVAPPVVALVPLGTPDPALVAHVAESVRRRFVFQVVVTDPVEMTPYAWYAPRKRWRAEKLLNQLDTLVVGPAFKVIGLTERPISTTKGERYDWGIAGLGWMPGRSCVLSSYLFRKFRRSAPASYQRYMENLVLHEFGHTLGLEHCPLGRCIMADAKGNAVRSAQASVNEFCPRCHKRIQRWLRAQEVQGSW